MSADNSPSVAAELDALIAELQQRRDGLEAAERDCETIPTLLEKADKAGKAKRSKAKQRRRALEDEAQAVRDRLRDAKLDLQETTRSIGDRVGTLAIRTEPGRAVLDRLGRLSPYPSVPVADQALSLLEALAETESFAAPAPPKDNLEKLKSLPLDRPSDEDRQTLAALLPDALAVHKDNYKSARSTLEIAEHTFNRLRNAQNVQPTTWRAARSYLAEAFSKRPQ